MRFHDRRKLERFPLHVRALVHVLGGNAGVKGDLPAYIRDISADGAYAYLVPVPETGAFLSIDILFVIDSLPTLLSVSEGVHATVQGKVIRKDQRGVAIRFDVALKFEQS